MTSHTQRFGSQHLDNYTATLLGSDDVARALSLLLPVQSELITYNLFSFLPVSIFPTSASKFPIFNCFVLQCIKPYPSMPLN